MSPIARAEVQHADNQTEMEHAQDRDTDALMPHVARRVLVYLMRQGVILAAENLKLLIYCADMKRKFVDILARFYISWFGCQARGGLYRNLKSIQDEQEDENQHLDDFPVLIRKRTLTVYDTLILLVLRKYYPGARNCG